MLAAIVCPGFKPSARDLDRGRAVLASCGIETELSPLLRTGLASDDVLSDASDAARAEDVLWGIRNPRHDFVWVADGGFGAARILPLLQRGLPSCPRSIFVGYSDATAICLALGSWGFPSWYGRTVACGEEFEEEALRTTATTIMHGLAGWEGPADIIRAGEVAGRLSGGNLSLFSQLLGTGWLPGAPRSTVLAIEGGGINVPGQSAFLAAEMFQRVVMQGQVKAGGLIFSDFADSYPLMDAFPPMGRVLEDYLPRLVPEGPIAGGPEFGHADFDLPIPLGAPVTFSASGGRASLRWELRSEGISWVP